jgi:arsenite methyltransferase
MPPRFIARQLSNPTGLVGRYIGRLMNKTNVRMNAFALSELDPKPTDRVLEIGFGGGLNLPTLIERAGFVAGVDRSEDVVRWARKRYAPATKAGRAEFRQGAVESLPFEPASFDKVCTVNTVYFWISLNAGSDEIARVLKPGGRVVVGFLPKERMDRGGYPADIFTSRAPEDVVSALRDSGFVKIEVRRPEPTTAWNVIAARR